MTTADPYKPTAQLQWLRNANGDHTLQQWYERPPFMGFAGQVQGHGEWRDVPVTVAPP